jgi:hypothetical protein
MAEDILTGGPADPPWTPRHPDPTRAWLDRRVAGATVIALLVVSAVAVLLWRGGDDEGGARIPLLSACGALVAFRDASTATEWATTRRDLYGVAVSLRGAADRDSRAVLRYTNALLGAPTDASGQLLPMAARACDRAGAPRLLRQIESDMT